MATKYVPVPEGARPLVNAAYSMHNATLIMDDIGEAIRVMSKTLEYMDRSTALQQRRLEAAERGRDVQKTV